MICTYVCTVRVQYGGSNINDLTLAKKKALAECYAFQTARLGS